MKKIHFILYVGFIAMFCNYTYAQDSKKNIESNVRKNFIPSIRKLAELENLDFNDRYILNRNEINIWAVRDFLYRFDDIDSVKWFLLPKGGYEAYFIQDGYGDRVFYDKHGAWQQTLIIYDEGKLPPYVRTTVKSVYFDFDIFLAEEVHTREGIEYFVHLEDKSTLKLVKMNRDGELEVIEDMTR